MAIACVYLCHQCISLVASVNSVWRVDCNPFTNDMWHDVIWVTYKRSATFLTAALESILNDSSSNVILLTHHQLFFSLVATERLYELLNITFVYNFWRIYKSTIKVLSELLSKTRLQILQPKFLYRGRVANPRPVAKIKTGRVSQPITDAAHATGRDRSWIATRPG